MAELYLTEEELAQAKTLQAEIRQAEAALSNVSVLSTEQIDVFDASIRKATSSLHKLVLAGADAGRMKVLPDSQNYDKYYEELLRAQESYVERKQAIRDKYKADVAVDPTNDEAYASDRDAALVQVDAELATAVGNMAIPAVQTMLDELKARLAAAKEQAEKDGDKDGAKAIGKVEESVGKIKVPDDNPKDQVAKWNELGKAVGTVKNDLKGLQGALGDAGEEFFEVADKVLGVAEAMITGIGTIVGAVSKGMTVAAGTAAGAMKTVEMASVVLAVISAALQIATAIAGLFNNDKQLAKIQKQSEELVKSLKFEADNGSALAIEDQVKAIDMLSAAYAKWQLIVVKNGKLQFNTVSQQDGLRRNKELTDQLIQSYTQLGYSVGKALGEEKYESSKGQLENLAAQQKELMIQRKAEEGKKKKDKGAIAKYDQEMIKIGEQMAQVLSKMTEDIIGGSASQIASKLGGALLDAFRAGEDGAKAWKDTVDGLVADIIKRMLIQKLLENEIAEVFDNYQKKWFNEDGSFNTVDNILETMPDFTDELMQKGEEFAEVVEALDKSMPSLGLKGEKSSGGTGSGGFQSMSQETAGELNGRFTDLQMKAGQMLGVASGLDMQFRLLSAVQLEARNIAAEVRDITALGYMQLVEIAGNTRAVVKPIKFISEQLENINTRIKEL